MQRCSEHLQTFKSGRKTALRVGPEPAELGQTQAQCMLLPFKNRLKQVEFQFSSPLLGCGTVSHMNLRILPTEQLAQTPALSKALLLRGFILWHVGLRWKAGVLHHFTSHKDLHGRLSPLLPHLSTADHALGVYPHSRLNHTPNSSQCARENISQLDDGDPHLGICDAFLQLGALSINTN